MDSKTKKEVIRQSQQKVASHRIAKNLGLSRQEVEAILSSSRKSAKASNGRRIIIASILLVIGIAGIVFAKIPRSITIDTPEGKLTIEKWAQNHSKNTHEFISRRNGDQILVRKKEIDESDMAKISNGIMEFSKTSQSWIDEALKADISAIKEVRKMFLGKTISSYFASDGQAKFLISNKAEMNSAESGDFILLLYYSPENPTPSVRASGGLLPIFFDNRANAVNIPCIVFTKTWFQALSMHELFHALKFRNGASSATAEFLSDDYIAEELDAHAIQRDFLDFATKGRYLRAIAEVVERNRNVRDFKEVWARMSVEDMEKIDSVFEKSPTLETQARSSQYDIDVARYYLAKKYSGSELKNKETEVYRAIQQLRYADYVRKK